MRDPEIARNINKLIKVNEDASEGFLIAAKRFIIGEDIYI